MDSVKDCRSFQKLWNERLDSRAGGSPEMARALADHASACEACRALGAIFADFERIPAPWSMVVAPPDSVIERWQATATVAQAIPQRGDLRQAVGKGMTLAFAAAIIGSTLVGVRASFPLLFSIEPAPKACCSAPNSLFLLEEAFSEASAMTRELAQEVSAPATRVSDERLYWPDRATLPALLSTQFGSDDPPMTLDPETSLMAKLKTNEPVGTERISDSARHAFRFLVGSAPDTSTDREAIGGF